MIYGFSDMALNKKNYYKNKTKNKIRKKYSGCH